MALAKYFPFMSDSRPLTSVRPLEVRTGEFAGKLESAEQKAREENLDGESFFRTFGPLVRNQLAQGVSKQKILQAFKERPDLCAELRNAGYVSEVNEQPELREILRQVDQSKTTEQKTFTPSPLTQTMHTIKGAGGFAGKLESAEQKAREENLDGESFFRTFGPLVRRQLAQGVSKQEILQAFKERPDLCTKLRNAGYVSEVNEQPELREILRQVNQA